MLRFDTYIDEVCKQIRCQKAWPDIAEELQSHMEDQKTAYIVMGMPEEEAERETVRQMGDAALVGVELDRTHRPRPDWALLGIVLAAVVGGLALQYLVLADKGGEYREALSSLAVALPFGIAALFVTYLLDYTILARWPVRIYLAFLAVCAAVILLPGRSAVGEYMADFGVLLFAPLFGGVIYSQKGRGIPGILLCGLLIIPVVLLTLFGIYGAHTICILLLAYLTMMSVAAAKNWFGGKRLWTVLLMLAPVLALMLTVWLQAGISYGRVDNFFAFYGGLFKTWVFPSVTIRSELTQQTLAGAQWIGHALVPDQVVENIYQFQSTYMLVYIIGRFGRLAGLAVIAAVALIVARMAALTFRQKNRLAFFVSLGVTVMIGLQAGLCIALNLTGWTSIPATTVPLLLGSGASLVANMCLAGIFLSVYRYKDIVSERALRRFGKIRG